MTQPEPNADGDETFEVYAEPASAAMEPEYEGVNVCRAAALSSMFGGNGQTVRELGDQLESIGFSETLRSGERVWRAEEVNFFGRIGLESEQRVLLWQRLNETADRAPAVAFLVSVLGSELERESVAAAAALWRMITELPPPLPRHFFDLSDIAPELRADDLDPWVHPERLDLDLDADADADADATEIEAVSWNPEQWREIYYRTTTRFPPPEYQIAAVHTLARLRLSLALSGR
ncbi:hypothetical protein [Streptomyces sp. NPDC002671]